MSMTDMILRMQRVTNPGESTLARIKAGSTILRRFGGCGEPLARRGPGRPPAPRRCVTDAARRENVVTATDAAPRRRENVDDAA